MGGPGSGRKKGSGKAKVSAPRKARGSINIKRTRGAIGSVPGIRTKKARKPSKKR